MAKKYQLCDTFDSKNIDLENIKTNILIENKKRQKYKTEKPINILPFGSGSTGNCFYVEIGNYKLLIDMGIGVRKVKNALNKYGKNLLDVDAVLVTHSHYDHCSAIKAICNNINCPIFATGETLKELKYRKEYKAKECVVEYDIKTEILKGLFITAFETDHDSDGSCGYVIESDGYKVSYVTDLGIVRENTIRKIGGSDVIILESNHDEDMLINGSYDPFLKQRILSSIGHLSNRQSFELQNILYELGTKNFLLAHLSKENNRPEIVKDLINKTHKGKDINIYICPECGDDFLQY